eukprot:1158965-Pelagomonas_calceolata.AAC.7
MPCTAMCYTLTDDEDYEAENDQGRHGAWRHGAVSLSVQAGKSRKPDAWGKVVMMQQRDGATQ